MAMWFITLARPSKWNISSQALGNLVWERTPVISAHEASVTLEVNQLKVVLESNQSKTVRTQAIKHVFLYNKLKHLSFFIKARKKAYGLQMF